MHGPKKSVILQGLGMAQAAVTERWGKKEEKMRENLFFSLKKNYHFFGIYFLVMPKYWRKQIFGLGNFPKVGKKQKT